MTQSPAPSTSDKSRLRKVWACLKAAAPPPWTALAGALVWAAIMAASASINLIGEGWQANDRIRDVAIVYALGGATGFAPGLLLANLISERSRAERRFAAGFLCLMVMTIGMTTAIYALQYRDYYAQWHAETFSMTWMFQFVFTSLGAVFQFSVSGLRLYFPIGFLALLAASLWFARGKR